MQKPSKINLFSKSLQLELEHQLKEIPHQTTNPIHHAEQAINKLIPILNQLKQYAIKYRFKNKAEEIEFFREIKPEFIAKFIYYSEMYKIETSKALGTKKVMRKYYNKELGKLKVFFDSNAEFYHYYRTGNRCLDSNYFTRNQNSLKLSFDSGYIQADHRFSTSHDYKVACILANDAIKDFLEEEIEKLKNKTRQSRSSSPLHKKQKWTGSKVALIELVYALHTEGAFNNGTTGLKEIARFFETAFDIDLGQFHRTFLEIRNRKSDRTKFLTALQERLIIRMDQADEKQ